MPIRGKPHQNIGVFSEQLEDPVLPVRIWDYDAHEYVQHGGLRAESCVGVHMQFMFLWHLGRNGKAAVPLRR